MIHFINKDAMLKHYHALMSSNTQYKYSWVDIINFHLNYICKQDQIEVGTLSKKNAYQKNMKNTKTGYTGNH